MDLTFWIAYILRCDNNLIPSTLADETLKYLPFLPTSSNSWISLLLSFLSNVITVIPDLKSEFFE